MADFIYKPHEPPPRAFAKGDIVHLIDSQGFDCGPLKIKRAGKRIVTVEDGRQYKQSDGRWFADGRPWPFPWIRLAVKCPECDGAGHVPQYATLECVVCLGSGQTVESGAHVNGMVTT